MPHPIVRLRWLRLSLSILVIFVVVFILSCFLFDKYVQFRMTDAEFVSFFRAKGISEGRIGYYEAAGRRIRYISTGSDTLPVILFIHGAPSSSSIFAPYLGDTTFRKRFHLLAVDRPGYGESGFGDPEPSIRKQAYIIHFLLDSLRAANRPVVLVGQSYGSSIAFRLAMDYPSLVDGLVLSGPSLAPGEEKTYWFTQTIESPLIRWFIPRMFVSANNEKVNHRAQLTEMLPLWTRIRVPVTYLQGAEDQLIYPSNAVFARQHLTHSTHLIIRLFPHRPHFIAYVEFPAIRREILDMADRAGKTTQP